MGVRPPLPPLGPVPVSRPMRGVWAAYALLQACAEGKGQADLTPSEAWAVGRAASWLRGGRGRA